MKNVKSEFIRERLYQKYIEPTRKKRTEYIGIEIEIPIVNLKREAVDFDNVHAVTGRFIAHFHFEVLGRDDEGNIYSAINPTNGDILSYDCSYNNLELSLGKEIELHIIQKRFNTYYTYLQSEFAKYQYALTGMGVNPYRNYNNNIPIPNGRYRMLFHHLHSYKNYNLPMYFHQYPEYGTFSSASQVQLDVEYDDLPMTINTFSKLEPVKALLFSNSVLLGEHEELLCCRDMFWENSTHGINPHNVGMFDCEFDNINDLLSYIESTSLYCTERDGKYINFKPVKVMDYFNHSSVQGEYYENGSYKKIDIEPEIEDLQYLRTFKFEDLTFRGTVEFRSVCCQPIKDSMTVAAFHVGLNDNLYELNEILSEDHVLYHHGYTATELRKLLVKSEFPEFINTNDLHNFVKQILDLSYKGLVKRGFGEEYMLLPLYERLETGINPAKKMLILKNKGMDLENIILDYGKIN